MRTLYISFFSAVFLSAILAEIPLDQPVFFTNPNLPGNYYFTIKGASQEDGAQLILDTKKPEGSNDHQKFIVSERNGFHVFKAVHSNKLLTVGSASTFVIQEHDLEGQFYEKNQEFALLLRNFTPGSIYCFYSRSEATLLQFNPDFNYEEGHWFMVTDEVMQALPTYGDPQKWQFELAN